MMNVGNPERAFEFGAAERRHRPGAAGVHHQQHIGIHPKALLEFDALPMT
jgi:hypothetical protein